MSIYYVDNICGSNDNDGLSAAHPVCDCNILKIAPGDTILFKRDCLFRGKINTIEGTEDAPVTYDAYGEGAMPTFCGSVNLSDKSLWEEVKKNIWVCSSVHNDEVANFVFDSVANAALKWSVDELTEQGDFYDECFGFSASAKEIPFEHKFYLYSKGNPGEVYNDIECVVVGSKNLAESGKNIIFQNLRFVNSGIHAIAGERKVTNMKVHGCVFENIGGAAWVENHIRFGNAIEAWNVGDNIEVTGCYFDNIYDSAVTQQGDSRNCKPSEKFIICDNVFKRCGMAAYEQRDKLPVYAKFNNNICIDAGEGFSKLGEVMPRNSEIWPQPMGHHVFLWRIEEAKSGCIEIKNNVFYNAPYGAAIYSIISEEAENLCDISDNTYYTENKELLNRWNGKNFKNCDEYTEKGAKFEKVNIDELLKQWHDKH